MMGMRWSMECEKDEIGGCSETMSGLEPCYVVSRVEVGEREHNEWEPGDGLVLNRVMS